MKKKMHRIFEKSWKEEWYSFQKWKHKKLLSFIWKEAQSENIEMKNTYQNK